MLRIKKNEKSILLNVVDFSKVKSIVFIIASLGMGGAERVISELSNQFIRMGIQVSIILISNNIVNYDLDNAINVMHIDENVENKKRIVSPFYRINLIKKSVKLVNPDIVISFMTTVNIYTCIALGLSRYKVILSERANPGIFSLSTLKKIVRKITYPLADGIVFQTELAKSYFSKRIQKKSVVIENPIKDNLPQSHSGTSKKKIVAIGRLNACKNYKLLVEAFHEVNKSDDNYILEIYGEGKGRAELENLIKKLNLNDKVLLKGNVNDVHNRIVDATLYVLTSDSEGMPNALMEAMAMGLPCIATDCPSGGPKKLIDHNENGMLFEVGNKHELVNCIKKIIHDKVYTEKLASNAIKIYDDHKLEYIATKWLDYMVLVKKIN